MDKTIVLVGNPNVGKSVIFNRLTGRYAVVSNYPGTSVDVSRGRAWGYQVIDTPGTASLIPSSEDEQVTREVLLREKIDVVVQVADSKNLYRTLLLTAELCELGLPMVLVLNMADEALERGIRIDRKKLSKLLGIPVIEAVGTTGKGMHELKHAITEARPGLQQAIYPPSIEEITQRFINLLPEKMGFARALVRMLVSGDESVRRYLPQGSKEAVGKALAALREKTSISPRLAIFNSRNSRAQELVREVQLAEEDKRITWLARLGEQCMKPFPGYLIVALVLYGLYEFVGVFAAGTLVDLLQNTLFGRYINPFLQQSVAQYIPWAIVRDFLVGPYGALTMAMTYALAIVLPIVSAFFFFFGLLEDSGYLPRLSVMLDRAFRIFGLNGKAVLPMVLGLGCGTMATLGSRILETRKERLLVVILLSLTIPCSAQLGVILGMLGGLSWKVTILWLASMVGSLVLVGAVAHRIIPGDQSPFIFEIPPLRMPGIGNIAMKVKMRLVWYLQEAVPLFVLGTAILFLIDRLHFMSGLEHLLRPVVTGILGLPVEVTQSFIIGFLRRDYGAAGLFVLARDGVLNPRQILVSSVAITLFVPCVAQVFVTIREQGWKLAALIFLFVTVYAFSFAGLLNYIVTVTGIL